MARGNGDIIDPETGKVRVFKDKCNTCIFRAGNLMFLREGALQEVINRNLKAGALLTCHKTLTYGGGEIPPTACRGFWDGYAGQTMAGRIAKLMIGIIEIDLPPEEDGDG